jgi:hypothetical protein
MAAQRDLLRELLIQVLNNCSDTILVASVGIRISKKRLVISAVHGCFDKRMECFADMQKIRPLFIHSCTRVAEFLGLRLTRVDLYINLVDEARKFTYNLTKK